jgi:hypothetical protein
MPNAKTTLIKIDGAYVEVSADDYAADPDGVRAQAQALIDNDQEFQDRRERQRAAAARFEERRAKARDQHEMEIYERVKARLDGGSNPAD